MSWIEFWIGVIGLTGTGVLLYIAYSTHRVIKEMQRKHDENVRRLNEEYQRQLEKLFASREDD